STPFSAAPVLSYLSLPPDYIPSPSDAPLDFLTIHLHQLPPNLLALFSSLLTPQQRTVLPIIRNRRQRYASSIPRELTWPEASQRWPELWEGRSRERPGVEQGKEEKLWAERGLEFLGGQRGQIGKLGQLLGEYEEEREAERMREVRREGIARREAEREAEEEEEEEEDDNDEDGGPLVEEQESPIQAQITFERVLQERFIYGLLDSMDYDAVDWDDKWDETDERDSEERWFDEEDEAD
ncbi:hypothetical protein K439DRAFT_1255095, partial [Ramaria rubella]